MIALRKLFRFKSSGSSKSVGSKDNSSKRSKKSSASSSSSSLSSSPSPHNSNSQSTRICLVGPHSSARNHQIVPTAGQPMSQSSSTPTKLLATHKKPCTIRSRRLMKEYHELCRLHHNNDNGFIPYSIELVNDTLYEWNIKVYQFDPDSQFYRDMKELDIDYILLNATFPENYPFAPPFIRVVSPHIEKGFVMEGGAICLELLTRHGWASAYTMEAVIMQLCASFVKGQARIKRNKGSGKEFSKKLAEASFRNVIKIHDRHGWVSPPIAEG